MEDIPKDKETAVFVIESQPPHLGELVSILREIDNYKLMYVCLSDKMSVIPIQHAMMIWALILQPYKDKLILCTWEEDFAQIAVLPERFANCKILTTAQETFVHLSSLNIDVKLVPALLGYNSTFIKAAYRQGRALDYLRAKTQLGAFKSENDKTTPRRKTQASFNAVVLE